MKWQIEVLLFLCIFIRQLEIGNMTYRVIGLMSGSSLDGLDIVFTELNESAGKWTFNILASACYGYSDAWKHKLEKATTLNALDYMQLHADYGQYTGEMVNRFIEENDLHFKTGLIASHGHTSFHVPSKKMTAQLGDGAAIAAVTRLPVVSDLRALDVAFGGQGAPIVPVAEKLLFPDYNMFLNLGGIANISFNDSEYIAFDVCPANRVLNLVANDAGKEFDEGGIMASAGKVNAALLDKLNAFDYYQQPSPKSLANDFGVKEVYPLLKESGLNHEDQLRTYVEHIAVQISNAIPSIARDQKLLVTGGGAFNDFLVKRISDHLEPLNISVTIPSEEIIKYKEALAMALIGVLRWRMEYNVFSSVTGAERDSIGGAVWIGQEA
jgi:anhydro-N-acetylmuramic acid kinase